VAREASRKARACRERSPGAGARGAPQGSRGGPLGARGGAGRGGWGGGGGGARPQDLRGALPRPSGPRDSSPARSRLLGSFSWHQSKPNNYVHLIFKILIWKIQTSRPASSRTTRRSSRPSSCHTYLACHGHTNNQPRMATATCRVHRATKDDPRRCGMLVTGSQLVYPTSQEV
jgi:hypothetical protein